MLGHSIVLPTFLGLQGIAGKRLCPFSIASQQFLDNIIVFVMGGADILFLTVALILKMIAAWPWRKIRLVNRVTI